MKFECNKPECPDCGGDSVRYPRNDVADKEMKITYEAWAKWNKKFHAGEFPHQRYGQAFCNTHNITDPSLFLQEDELQALNDIWDNYVEARSIEYHSIVNHDKETGMVDLAALIESYPDAHFDDYLFCSGCQQDFNMFLKKK